MNGRITSPYQGQSEEEVRSFLKCEVLEFLRHLLSKSLIPDRHMDYLRSKHILSEEDCDEINHPPTRQKRASKLLNILSKKGGEAYDALCGALMVDGTQTFLVKQLHQDFERRLQLYKNLVGQEDPHLQTGQLPIPPPNIQPPPPPFHNYHGNKQALSDGAFSGGYAASFPSCPAYTSDSKAALSSAVTMDMSHTGQDEAGQGDDSHSQGQSKKQRLIVADYLHVTVREQSPVTDDASSSSTSFQVIPSSMTGTDSSLPSHGDQRQPPFMDQPSASGILSRPRLHTSLHAPTQEISRESPIINSPRQHQRLSPRGSNDTPQSFLAEGGVAPPSLPASAADKLQPVEHEETDVEDGNKKEPVQHEDCSISSPSSNFFGSLDNQSLARPSGKKGSSSTNRTLLCDTALSDQQKALEKLACCEGDDLLEKGTEEKQSCVKTSEDLSLHLSQLSAVHSTERKEVDTSPPDFLPLKPGSTKKSSDA